MNIRLAVIALACLAAHPAWAINKCTGADGKVVFQDAPCAGKGETVVVRPAAGAAKAKAVEGDGEAPLSNAQRIEGQIAASQKERRLRELEQREVPRAESAIHAHMQACQEEQDQLERSKGMYVQNLYGKTDAAQKASEQAAAAARCDTKDRELRAQAERLKKQCTALGGCN